MTLLLALLLCLVLPGLGAGALLTSYAVSPARPGLLLARSLASGVALWLLGSGLLARTVGITQTTSWTLSAVLGLAGAGALALPRSRQVLRGAGAEARYAAGILLTTAVGWLPAGIAVWSTSWAPLGSTPWYYYFLASQVAETGRIPASIPEWGTQVPFLADYRLLSTGTAMLLTQAPGLEIQVLAAIVTVGVLALGAGAALLAHAFGASRLVSLAAAPVAVGTGVGFARLTGYRPEGIGLGMLMLTVVLILDALRHRDRASLVPGCALGAVLSQVHGIALTTAGAFLVGAAVTVLPWRAAPGASERFLRRMWPALRRAIGAGLLLGGSIVVLSLLLGGVSGTGHGTLEDAGGTQDLTWEFYRAARGYLPSMPPSNLALVRTALDDLYWVPIVAAAAGLLTVAAAARRGDARARQALLFIGVSVLVLGAVASVFAFAWKGYVPRRTGSQRLVMEMTLLFGPLVAVALSTWPWSWPRRRTRLDSVVLVAVLCLASAVGCARAIELAGQQRPVRSDLEALAELDLPQDSIVLTNGYIEGYISQVTPAHGLVEGRAPYTFPGLMRRAQGLLRAASRYYAGPLDNHAFLVENDIAYVAVSLNDSFSLGTANLFHTEVRVDQLDADPWLTPVLTRPDLLVYRVTPPEGG